MLLSSRNTMRADFEHVISSIKNGDVNPSTYINKRLAFDRKKNEFEECLDPANEVIKAMVEIE